MIFKIVNSLYGTGHQLIRLWRLPEVPGVQALTLYFLDHAEFRGGEEE